MAKDKSQSMFALLSGNMRAYVISWVTTFFASLINSVWTTWVFHFDFVSSIDGALASQIGIVLLNDFTCSMRFSAAGESCSARQGRCSWS